MKPKDQIVALAEMDGWEGLEPEVHPGIIYNWGVRPGFIHDENKEIIPEYTSDLNAIVPLVAKWAGQDPKRRSDFSNELHKVSGKRPGTPVNSGGTPVVSDFHKFTGPANEWCEALLRAAGKWEGSVIVNQKE
jgi:hypothetical protein